VPVPRSTSPAFPPIFATFTLGHPDSAVMNSFRAQKRRRTATLVLSGDFDPRPQRDVLTSLLNGVPVYKVVERAEEEEERRARKKERKEREKDKKRARAAAKSADKQPNPVPSTSTPAAVAIPLPASTSTKRPAPAPRATSTSATTSSFWQARPTINIATLQRSRSVTPPMCSSPPTTPGPSISSSTSATSSKRPRTPDDGEDFTERERSVGTSSPPPPAAKPVHQRKKRVAARKGWKGWVEGSPPPSQKLINLDIVDVIPGERKTRSGKSFDAIGVGKDSWV
jgi:hypothetical protein